MNSSDRINPPVAEERIALPCPNCGSEIYRPLSWFRQTYATCPACGGGLTASQFEARLRGIEEAFEESLRERFEGAPGCGGCGKSDCR